MDDSFDARRELREATGFQLIVDAVRDYGFATV